MTQIEKIARLIGDEVESVTDQGVWLIEHGKPLNRDNEHPIRLFNPHTKKSDLMDVECALGIDVLHDEEYITAEYWQHGLLEFDDKKRIANYAHNKFTARSHAVCAVAEQIYDKGQV